MSKPVSACSKYYVDFEREDLYSPMAILSKEKLDSVMKWIADTLVSGHNRYPYAALPHRMINSREPAP
jgi:hypothetical protein